MIFIIALVAAFVISLTAHAAAPAPAGYPARPVRA
jgi:hypothetical protein